MFFRKPVPGHDLSLGTIVGAGQMEMPTAATLLLSRKARGLHTFVCGATGTGKSKFLESLIRQDILDWRRHRCGMLVVDPHGSLYDSTLAYCALARLERPIIPIDLRRQDWIVGYNPLRPRALASPAVIIDAMVMAMAYVWGASGTDQTPRLARWACNVFTPLYEKGLTLAEAVIGRPSLIIHERFCPCVLDNECTEPNPIGGVLLSLPVVSQFTLDPAAEIAAVWPIRQSQGELEERLGIESGFLDLARSGPTSPNGFIDQIRPPHRGRKVDQLHHTFV